MLPVAIAVVFSLLQGQQKTDTVRIVRLLDGTRVELAAGAKIDQPVKRIISPAHVVVLEGRARFAVRSHLVIANRQIVNTILMIRTRGALLLATDGDVEVDAHGDTTDVYLAERTEKLHDKGNFGKGDMLLVSPSDSAMIARGLQTLGEGDRAQGIRGFMPVKLSPRSGREH